MASIVIRVTASAEPVPEGDDIYYGGVARCSGMDNEDPSINWSCEIAPTALAATVNNTILGAAVDAADIAGYTVGMLDKKTIIGGAVGL